LQRPRLAGWWGACCSLRGAKKGQGERTQSASRRRYGTPPLAGHGGRRYAPPLPPGTARLADQQFAAWKAALQVMRSYK
jgi:hypothetical protein